MIFILKLRETFLTKRFFQEFLSKPSPEAPPPLTQIRNVVSKEETCPKRFSQKDSLKTYWHPNP